MFGWLHKRPRLVAESKQKRRRLLTLCLVADDDENLSAANMAIPTAYPNRQWQHCPSHMIHTCPFLPSGNFLPFLLMTQHDAGRRLTMSGPNRRDAMTISLRQVDTKSKQKKKKKKTCRPGPSNERCRMFLLLALCAPLFGGLWRIDVVHVQLVRILGVKPSPFTAVDYWGASERRIPKNVAVFRAGTCVRPSLTWSLSVWRNSPRNFPVG